jgi:hypothetical protein
VHEVLFKCVVEGDLQGVRTYIESGEDVNGVNEEVCLRNFQHLILAAYNALRLPSLSGVTLTLTRLLLCCSLYRA